jgi:hypothetical protein
VKRFANAGGSWDDEKDDSDSAVRHRFTFNEKVGDLYQSLFPVAHVIDPQDVQGRIEQMRWPWKRMWIS